MSSDCWPCKQKAEWKMALLQETIAKAKLESLEANETMAIVKTSGCIYLIFKASEITTQTVTLYVNANQTSRNILSQNNTQTPVV